MLARGMFRWALLHLLQEATGAFGFYAGRALGREFERRLERKSTRRSRKAKAPTKAKRKER